MKIETVTVSDIRKDLPVDGDGFNINVDGKFNVYINREAMGYFVDVWVGDTCVESVALWDDTINDIMKDERRDSNESSC